jgi:hypothetical protein
MAQVAFVADDRGGRLMAMASEHTEHEVTLQIEFADLCEPGELEERAELIHQAVEEHASHIALGPVVSGQFDPPRVELDFSVAASSRAELFQRIAELVEILETHTGIERATGASMAERELAPA